jgi:hypothetical protein
MMKDITGQIFGRLKVVALHEQHPSGRCLWKCVCECGEVRIVRGGNLASGNTRSCGCARNEATRRRSLTHGESIGREVTPEFGAFRSAKGRCLCPTNTAYKNYGGRGIEFRFASFDEFLAEVGRRPSSRHSLNRIENSGHYEKGNVEWSTDEEQANNRRITRWLTAHGVTLALMQWARKVGLPGDTIRRRLSNGWTVEQALGLEPRNV